MTRRRLEPGEKAPILDALLTSAIASPALCERAVDACEIVAYRPALRSIRCARSTIAYVALRQRASGITLGSRVYIRAQLFDRHGRVTMDLLAHELAHVVQFMRDGTLPFLQRYLWDYTCGRFRGLGDLEAYLAIPYEIEARRVAAALKAR